MVAGGHRVRADSRLFHLSAPVRSEAPLAAAGSGLCNRLGATVVRGCSSNKPSATVDRPALMQLAGLMAEPLGARLRRYIGPTRVSWQSCVGTFQAPNAIKRFLRQLQACQPPVGQNARVMSSSKEANVVVSKRGKPAISQPRSEPRPCQETPLTPREGGLFARGECLRIFLFDLYLVQARQSHGKRL